MADGKAGPPPPAYNEAAGSPGPPPGYSNQGFTQGFTDSTAYAGVQTQYGYGPQQNQQYGMYPPQQMGMQGMQSNSNVIVTQPTHVPIVQQHVPDNQCLAIIATLFCWPIGIIAIMRASESRNAMLRNDVSSAVRNANDARRLALTAIGIGVLIYVLVVIISVVVSINSYNYYCPGC